MNTLLIAASGKSTRFGGEPKAFAPVLGEVNVARTIRLARGYFSDIRVIVSEDTKKMGQEALPGVPSCGICRIEPFPPGDDPAPGIPPAAAPAPGVPAPSPFPGTAGADFAF